MKFKEAEERLQRVLDNNDRAIDERYKFISDLLVDTDISAQDKLSLLRVTSTKSIWYPWNLGMFIVKFNSTATLEKYISLLVQLLEQNVPPKDLLSLLEFETCSGSYANISFCALLPKHQTTAVVQQFLIFLYKLNERGVHAPDIFSLLNKPSFDNNSEVFETFFSNVKNDLDKTCLELLLVKYLSQFINFEMQYNAPKEFLSKLIEYWENVENGLQLLPGNNHNKDLLQLRNFVNIYRGLKQNNLSVVSITLDRETNPSAYISQLLFLSACLERAECNSQLKFVYINFQGGLLSDARLVPALAIIFKRVKIVSFQNCKIDQGVMRLLQDSKREAGSDYRVIKVLLNNDVEINKTILPDLFAWVPPSSVIRIVDNANGKCTAETREVVDPKNGAGPVFVHINIVGVHSADNFAQLMQACPRETTKVVSLIAAYDGNLSITVPNVAELNIQNSRMAPSTLMDNKFLRFLDATTELKSLVLKNLNFDDSGDRIACMQQALQKSELKNLELDFPMTDAEFESVMQLLQSNQSLEKLILPQGQFKEETLNNIAKLLCDSNLSLKTIEFNSKTIKPKLLDDVIARNRTALELAEKQKEVITILEKFTNFSGSADVTYTHSLLREHWQYLCQAHIMSQDLKDKYYPTPRIAVELCEKVAIAISGLLVKFGQIVRDFSNLQINIRGTLQLLDNCISLLDRQKSRSIFYKNLYTFCVSCYDRVVRPDTNNVHAASMRDVLFTVLSRVQTENIELSHQVNDLFFSLFQHKILCILKASGHDDGIKLLEKNVRVTTNITGLINRLKEYLVTEDAKATIVAPFTLLKKLGQRVPFGINNSLKNVLIELNKFNRRTPPKNQDVNSSESFTASVPGNICPPLLSPASLAPPGYVPTAGTFEPTPYYSTTVLTSPPPPPYAPGSKLTNSPVVVSQPIAEEEKFTKIDDLLRQLKDLNVDLPKDIPDRFLCSSTRKIMSDPVSAPDGNCYDRKEITQLIVKSNKNNMPVISLKNGEIITVEKLIYQQQLYAEIIQYLEQKLRETKQIRLDLSKNDPEKQQVLTSAVISSTTAQSPLNSALISRDSSVVEIPPGTATATSPLQNDSNTSASELISAMRGLNSPVFSNQPATSGIGLEMHILPNVPSNDPDENGGFTAYPTIPTHTPEVDRATQTDKTDGSRAQNERGMLRG